MKVIITESKLFNTIYDHIDETNDRNDIDWVYGPNEEGDDWQENPDDENFLIFFKGEWYGEDESDIIFNYFDVDYYDEHTVGTWRDKAPILEVMGEYAEHLNSMFGNHWVEPMKKWFQDKFNLPVKTVTTYY